jgi:hypothetical protein
VKSLNETIAAAWSGAKAAWDGAPTLARWIAAAVVVLVMGSLWTPSLFGSAVAWLESGREGAILVDTPEVYTRERLVNDRFREDKWLSDVLEDQRGLILQAGVQGLVDERSSATAGLGVASKDSESGAGARTAGPEPQVPDKPGNPDALRLRPSEQFQDVSDFRRSVRDELLENQLDDRHDIGANTLVRLKFDASIIPERGSTGWAVIVVDVLPYCPERGSLESKEACWDARDRVYTEWLRDTQSRITLSVRSGEESLEARVAERDLVIAALGVARERLYRILEPEEVQRRVDARLTPLRRVLKARRELVASCRRNRDGGVPLPEGVTPEEVALPLDRDRSCGPLCCSVLEGDKRLEEAADGPLYEMLEGTFEVLASAIPDGCPRSPFSQVHGICHVPSEAVDTATVRNWVLTDLVIAEVKDSEIAKYADFRAIHCDSGRCHVRVVPRSGGRRLPGAFFDESSHAVPKGFIDRLRRTSQAFSYAITPKVSAARVRRRSEELRQFNARMGSLIGRIDEGVGPSLDVTEALQRDLTAMASLPLVVGFSDGSANSELKAAASMNGEATTRFGWFVGPEFTGSSRDGVEQQGKQIALSALISVPGWWNRIGLRVKHCWARDIEGTGVVRSCGSRKTWKESWARIPLDASAVSRAFDFIIPREPYTLARDPQERQLGRGPVLTAGAEGSLVIEGQRLWRSTAVTLGAQGADWIEVLPSMQGIIAHFDCVQPPTRYTDRKPVWAMFDPDDGRPVRAEGFGDSFDVPVTVWTSEGKASWQPVAVRVLANAVKCPKPRPLERMIEMEGALADLEEQRQILERRLGDLKEEASTGTALAAGIETRVKAIEDRLPSEGGTPSSSRDAPPQGSPPVNP